MKKVCVIYQDDEFGLEVLRGGEAGLKSMGMEFTEKTSFKRGATDFSSQVAKMKGSGCELVVMGTIIRETIGTIGEARKTGFNPILMGTSASYTELIHKLGGKAMDGFYSTMGAQQPYLDEASQPLRFWATKYKTKFNEDPTIFSVYGYQIIDVFAKAAAKAGPNLTTDSFIKAMDTMSIPADIFGSAAGQLQRHQAPGQRCLAAVADRRWQVEGDFRLRDARTLRPACRIDGRLRAAVFLCAGIIRRHDSRTNGWTVESLDLDAQGVARNARRQGGVHRRRVARRAGAGAASAAQEEQLGAGHDDGAAARERAARAPGLPALRPACRRLRRLQDAASASGARRWPSSSACSKTTCGTWPRSSPSRCCGRSRARPGATAIARGCRCAMWRRRARCWWAFTSASRATWPTCRCARCCRRAISALLMPLRALIGSMDQRDRLPQIELALRRRGHARWCCATWSR